MSVYGPEEFGQGKVVGVGHVHTHGHGHDHGHSHGLGDEEEGEGEGDIEVKVGKKRQVVGILVSVPLVFHLLDSHCWCRYCKWVS